MTISEGAAAYVQRGIFAGKILKELLQEEGRFQSYGNLGAYPMTTTRAVSNVGGVHTVVFVDFHGTHQESIEKALKKLTRLGVLEKSDSDFLPGSWVINGQNGGVGESRNAHYFLQGELQGEVYVPNPELRQELSGLLD